MKIDTEGTYTLQYTAEDACGNETIEEREVIVADPTYGIYWDGSSNPKWTRLGLSAKLADPQPAIANGNGSSPFDNIMPWSGMKIVEDAEAGTLVSIPKYWYKIESHVKNEKDLKIQISNEPLDGFSVSPAHRDRGDGAGERDVVYVGRYFSASDYKSKSNTQPLANVTRGQLRNGITALGSDIWQFDFSMYWTIVFLYLVEYATWNSQAAIGYGCGTTYPTVPNTGSTDAMQYHTGTDASARDEYGNIQYRHIEGLWSGLYQWVDGIVMYRPGGAGDYPIYEYDNPSKYADTLVGKDVDAFFDFRLPTYGGVPDKWTDGGASYPLLVPSKSNNTSIPKTEYSCDTVISGSSSGTFMFRTGGLYASQNAGLFCWQVNEEAPDTQDTFGGRLQKLPSA